MGSLIKASIWLTASELIFNLSGYITHSVLGRSLGPAEYGRYSIIITFSTMIIVLIGRGVPIAMSKYLSEVSASRPREIPAIKRTSAKLQFVIVGVVTIAYFFLAPVFAKLLHDETLTSLFQISSLIIPTFAAASFYVYYYNGIQKFEKQAFLKFFRSIAKVVLIVGLAFLFSVPGAILGHALAPFSVFVVAYLVDPYRKMKGAAGGVRKISWQKLFNFAWPITLFMLFYEIMITVDLYLVKALLGDDAMTGLYNSAITVGRIPFYAFYFLTIILLPKVSETTSQGLKKETQRIISSAMRFMLMLLLPSVALLAAFAPSAIRFFYGAQYSEGSAALTILALSGAFLSVFYVLAFVLNGAGKNKIPMWTALTGCALNVILVSRLIPVFGLEGAALGTAVTSFVVMVIIVVYTQKNLAKFIFFGPIAKYIFGSIGIYLLATNFFVQGRFIFIVWSILLLGVYLLLLFIFGELNKKDIDYIRKAITTKKK